MNFVEELKWRGMLHDMMPGTRIFEMGIYGADYYSPGNQKYPAGDR